MSEATTIAAIVAALFAMLTFFQVSALRARVDGLSQQNAKLDALLKQAGVAFDPFAEITDAVADALRRGQKIEAIKLHREATGVGLKEAKDFVEEAQRRAGF